MSSLDAMLNAIDPGDDSPLRWQDDAQDALRKTRDLILTTKWAEPEARANARDELADIALEVAIEAATNPAVWEAAYKRIAKVREGVLEQRPERWRKRAAEKREEAKELEARASEATGPAKKQRLASRAAEALERAAELEAKADALEAGLGNGR